VNIRRWRAIAIARLVRHAHWRRALILMNRRILLQSVWRIAGQSVARTIPSRIKRGVRELRAARMMKAVRQTTL
jgi:hypothetical protein